MFFHVKCERNCKWFNGKWFCKSKAICYTYYLSNEVHQIAKCQSSSKAQMPLTSLYFSLQNCISWISQFKDQIYLIFYTTFTNLKNIFFFIISTPHYKKGHELKQAFWMLYCRLRNGFKLYFYILYFKLTAVDNNHLNLFKLELTFYYILISSKGTN